MFQPRQALTLAILIQTSQDDPFFVENYGNYGTQERHR